MAARVPSQCATSAVIPLSRVNGAIVKPLTVWHMMMVTSSTLPEPVHGVTPPALRWTIPSVPTTRPLHMPTRPLSHHGLPAHPGCPQCVTTVNGVIPRPRSARTSTELVPDKNDAFEHYHQHLSTTVQTVTLVLTYTMSRHHHHQTEC